MTRSSVLTSRDLTVNGKTYYAQWTHIGIVSRTVFAPGGALIRVQERLSTGQTAWNASAIDGINRRVIGAVSESPFGPLFITTPSDYIAIVDNFKRKRSASEFNWPHQKTSRKEPQNARYR